MTVGLLAAALLLSACSIFFEIEKGPERGNEFVVLPEPVVPCSDPAFVPNCGLTYAGILTERKTFTIGPSPNETEYLRLVFDDSLQIFDLGGIPGVNVPLITNHRYSVVVELVPTVILGYGAFEVTDAEGLVFFATTEVYAGWEGNPSLPEGWRISIEDGGYDSHGLGCGVRSTPQVMVVEHESERVRLVQGEAKQLGDYLITALIVEEVDNSDIDCLDYFVPELSYTIAREVN